MVVSWSVGRSSISCVTITHSNRLRLSVARPVCPSVRQDPTVASSSRRRRIRYPPTTWRTRRRCQTCNALDAGERPIGHIYFGAFCGHDPHRGQQGDSPGLASGGCGPASGRWRRWPIDVRWGMPSTGSNAVVAAPRRYRSYYYEICIFSDFGWEQLFR